MKCPKCGFEQPEGAECVRCGVVFRKIDPTFLPPGIDVGFIPGLEAEETSRTEEGEFKKVVVFTSQFKIQGTIKMTAKGYRARISDVLNDTETQFIPILNAQISTIEGELKVPTTRVVVVNKNSITFLIPA